MRRSSTAGAAEPEACIRSQPGVGEPGYFDNIVPEEFEARLNQPDSENESVRSKLKLPFLVAEGIVCRVVTAVCPYHA